MIEVDKHYHLPTYLPRIPQEQWESKRRPDQTMTCRGKTMQPDGSWVDNPPVTVTMPGGIFTEDLLIWCDCSTEERDKAGSFYVEEPDGRHGWVCNQCCGVVQYG